MTVNDEEPIPEPELPEVGTVYNFTGYVDETTSTPSSTGTITYEGEYSGNTDYVYGTATVTFTGQSEAQTLTVYMTKEGFITTLNGGRAQVYTLQDSNFVSLGYGELIAVPVFETFNIILNNDYSVSGSLQTDTDWTGKEIIIEGEQDQEMQPSFNFSLIPDATDPTLLVINTEYEDIMFNDAYLNEVTSGLCTMTVDNGTEEYENISYSWTNNYLNQ